MAHMVQFAGRKPGKFPVFISHPGAGKGSLVRMFEKVIGEHHVLDIQDVAKGFTGDHSTAFARKTLICLDEVS